MCIGGLGKVPDVPKVPERQSVKAPTDPVRGRSAADEARRRGMMATILSATPGVGTGALSPPSTTAAMSGGKTYLG